MVSSQLPSPLQAVIVHPMVWRDDRVFEDFADLLRKRLEFGTYGSEDSVRYMLFAALVRHGVQPERVVMEFPHPGMDKKKIDTVVVGDDGKPVLAVEFKYHRRSLSGRNKPRTLAAGSLFKDISRLAVLEWPADRYFIYLSDDEMALYLRSPGVGLGDVLDLPVGSELELTADTFASHPPTFFRRVGVWPGHIAIRTVAARDLPFKHLVRVYEVGRVRQAASRSPAASSPK
jgi:hypothetical protein